MPECGGLEAVERIDLYVGGAVANTGMALSRLGVPVGAVGCVGKDHLGRIVMEELSGWADGLWIHEDPTRSTSATLLLVHPDGARTFISAVGANAGLTEDHLSWEGLARARARDIHLGYALLLPGLDGANNTHSKEGTRSGAPRLSGRNLASGGQLGGRSCAAGACRRLVPQP